jgi:hypothetical protein
LSFVIATKVGFSWGPVQTIGDTYTISESFGGLGNRLRFNDRLGNEFFDGP